MRRSSTAKALLTFTTMLAIAGCSSPGTTEGQAGAGESSSATATPSPSCTTSPSSTTAPTERGNGVTTTVPSIEVVSQQADISNELSDKLESASAQFTYKDFSLTLVPVEGHNRVESGSIKFAVDSDLPPSCMDITGEEGSGPCASLFFIATTSSEATDGRDVQTGYPAFFNLDKDVGESILQVNIPYDAANKAFAGVIIKKESAMMSVESGEVTDKFGPKL